MRRDMMAHFQLFQPTDIDAALDLLDRWGDDAWALAGGYDSLDWFKDRTKKPTAVIDLERIDELRGVREVDGGGLEIGAMTTLTDLVRDARVQERFGLLAQAAERVASPQIRSAATLGGNLCQDTRCWYYRSGLACYRAGGNTCYADSPVAMNREHCIFGANRCVAVSPSDVAPALVALDAEMVVRDSRGERTVAAEDFFMSPAIDITRMTVLEPGQLLTAVRIPSTWSGATFHFEKVADRNTFDFALVSLAGAMRLRGDVIEDVRLVAGAVECVPRRLQEAEARLRGASIGPGSAEAAAAAAVQDAEPLRHNGFKVPLLGNLVARAVRGD